MTATTDAVTVSPEGGSRLREKSRATRSIGLAVVVLTLIAVITSWLVLTGLTPIEPTQQVVLAAMVVNGCLIATLLVLVVREFLLLRIARRERQAAARLHGRIITQFSLMAAIPALIVAILASITLNQGLDRWFEDRTRRIVDNALTVANAYLQEHARVLRGDLLTLAADLDRAKQVYEEEPLRFDLFLRNQAEVRLIPAVFLLRADGSVVVRQILDPNWQNVLMPPPAAFTQADKGEAVMIAPGAANQVGGVVRLQAYEDTYLYIARPMDARVLEHLRLARDSANQYKEMDRSRFGTQVAFALVYTGVALALLLAAIWLGIGFANRLVAPIRRLITAADQVSKGNFDVAVPVKEKEGDLAHLGTTFNTMTAELRSQRTNLLAASELSEARRRFTETVLSGVTAGVAGLDADGRVTLFNRALLGILGLEESLEGRTVAELLPEVAPFVAEAIADPAARPRQRQIVARVAGSETTLDARIAADTAPDGRRTWVLTLDDISDLVTAQRSSAWADVARRIAHEIKNPLTPIQLSAERLKRRYGAKVQEDRAVFDQCIDTIVRQVGDIERMVNEFSSFARMPKPQKEATDLAEAVRESVFLISVANPEITFTTELPEQPMRGQFDRRLLTQAITNLVKNATEAIEAVPPEERGAPKVTVVGARTPKGYRVDVIDTGIGLPSENRRRLLEPYMTTREKGTGLGLAIVRKIAEEHGGTIELLDSPAVATGGRGALVRLTFPFDGTAPAEPSSPETSKRTEVVEVHGV